MDNLEVPTDRAESHAPITPSVHAGGPERACGRCGDTGMVRSGWGTPDGHHFNNETPCVCLKVRWQQVGWLTKAGNVVTPVGHREQDARMYGWEPVYRLGGQR